MEERGRKTEPVGLYDIESWKGSGEAKRRCAKSGKGVNAAVFKRENLRGSGIDVNQIRVSTEFEGVPAFCPRQVVRDFKAALDAAERLRNGRGS